MPKKPVKRSRAISEVLKREPRSAASKRALSAQGRRAAKARGGADLRRAARTAARSRYK